MAQSRHPDRVGECLLSGVKRTSKFKSVTSAFDPQRTSTCARLREPSECGSVVRASGDIMLLIASIA